ncbi:MAG: aminopeptidase [Lachnospiraceae bacterium]|nr:aminopeptidase [Lachnospiraceae bacterium]
MTFEEKKMEYARLIVKAGVHVRKGQTVFIRCAVEHYEFARLVTRYCYEEGAREVIVRYGDTKTARMRYDFAPVEVFKSFPEWDARMFTTFARNDVAFINIVGEDPEAMKGVDPEKISAAVKASSEALKEYRKLQSTMAFKWNIVAIPEQAWAKKVYPNDNESVAVTRLWNAIFGTVRVGEGDAYEQWMAHAENLQKKREALTAYQFKTLHYTNALGTDFTVGLVKNHRWEGGAERDRVDGGPFFANMPTEEVFTMPDNRVAEGRLVAALPLSYHGNLIENFEFTFKDGEVAGFKAEKGEEVLKRMLEQDSGAKRLGECALVPFPNPVSSQGVLFYDTLFDENAACHFALGACYETNLEGGENMSEEELREHGANQSLIHVDFMVGTEDLRIVGTTWDGEEITVFENGTWAF